MIEPSERALLGGSVFIMELDDEDQTMINETASLDYGALSIVESIGEPDFKSVYLIEINNIKSEPIGFQREFCRRVLDKISEIYKFEILNVSLDDTNSINNVYSFLEFLEFDSLDFLSSVWVFFDYDLRKINIPVICNKISDRIISEIEEQIDLHILSEMSSEFLRTYNKEDLIKWFVIQSERLKIEITLILMSKGDNYVGSG